MRIEITDEIIETIKKLDFNISSNPYYDFYVEWEVNDGNPISLLRQYLYIINILGELDSGIPIHYKEMMRRMYFSDLNSYDLTLDPKKLFGNSNILGDVRNILVDVSYNTNDPNYKQKMDYSYENMILYEFILFYTNTFLKKFQLKERYLIKKPNTITNYVYWTKKGIIPNNTLSLYELDKKTKRNNRFKELGI